MKPSPIASILIFVAVIALVIAAFSASWFTASFGDSSGGFGLIRAFQCGSDGCESELIFKHRIRGPELFAIVTFIFVIATIGVAIPTGLLLLKPGRRVLSIVTLAIGGVTLIVALLFAGMYGFKGPLGPGLGFIVFIVGILAAIGGCIMAMVRPAAPAMGMPMRPMGYPPQGGYPNQPMPMHGQPMGQPGMPMQQPMGQPMQQPMVQPVAAAPAAQPQGAQQGQACTTCGTPTMWVAQYNRWFCQRCNRYL